jgi:formylglycine-generating enzyme required for sulfatase activity
MKRRNLWSISVPMLLAALIAAICVTSHNSERDDDELYAAGEAALAAGQWDQAVIHFREVCDRIRGYCDVEEKLTQALDASMVLVPAGEFLMGSDTGDVDERPQRRVYLDAFEIDRCEVTNVQHRRFLLTTGREPPRRWPRRFVAFLPDHSPDWHRIEYPPGEATYPVVAVRWEDAAAYCASVGKRLPTEAEWEKAARGSDGRTYPWGDGWDPGKASAGATGARYTQSVGSYLDGASPRGVLDMAGNVWEWVADLYGRQYYAHAPDHNPQGPESGTGELILRGEAWDSLPGEARASYRNATNFFGPNYRVGFRCARGIGS